MHHPINLLQGEDLPTEMRLIQRMNPNTPLWIQLTHPYHSQVAETIIERNKSGIKVTGSMSQSEYTKKQRNQKTPREYSGGLPLGATLIPIAVIIVNLLVISLVSKLTFPSVESSIDVNHEIAQLFTPEVQYWAYKILPWSEQYGLDPNLVATVIQIESCGHPEVQSPVGAMGLFQVMPYHFSANEDPYKPNINARRGLAYLKQALDVGNGDIRLAFAGYNGGINGAKKPETSWPAETIRFVYWGEGIYKDATKDKSHSDRLNEWLSAGGASLCNAASSNLGLNN